MPDPLPPPALAALLRQAGHDLPPEAVANLAEGHALLVAMLALLPAPPPAAEAATFFRAAEAATILRPDAGA